MAIALFSLGRISPYLTPGEGLPSSHIGFRCGGILELSLPPLAETWHFQEDSCISLKNEIENDYCNTAE